jgi:hypothetical protein
MTFDEFYFIEGQPVQGHMTVDPFDMLPVGYPNGFLPTFQHIPLSPLDLFSVNKDQLDDSVKEKKKKRRRKRLLKFMILSQMMNNNN